jgi:hypothetical protein
VRRLPAVCRCALRSRAKSLGSSFSRPSPVANAPPPPGIRLLTQPYVRARWSVRLWTTHGNSAARISAWRRWRWRDGTRTDHRRTKRHHREGSGLLSGTPSRV